MQWRNGEVSEDFVVPNYSGACISNLMPASFLRLSQTLNGDGFPTVTNVSDAMAGVGYDWESISHDWLPKELSKAERVVLLVLDGLGWRQFVQRLELLPTMSKLSRSMVHSVAPTTTAAALTSISTGFAPARHGVVGYRMRIGATMVLNTLRWNSDERLRHGLPEPRDLQPIEPFFGFSPAVVTKAVYENTGFTKAHLRSVRMNFWRTFSGITSRISELLNAGERFVYAYYEGIDTTAHEWGLGDQYDQELQFVDGLIQRILDTCPPGTALLVTSDHGQVVVPDDPLHLPKEVTKNLIYQSGEGRFRWLHVRSNSAEEVKEACEEHFGPVARVLSRQEVIQGAIFGPNMSPEVQLRLGDIALVASKPVAFFDPKDTGPFRLVCRHGALTSEEVEVPLLSMIC